MRFILRGVVFHEAVKLGLQLMATELQFAEDAIAFDAGGEVLGLPAFDGEPFGDALEDGDLFVVRHGAVVV